tara:strand:- start:156 stop:344 length:189 start_codon:yes stop_codon:yes gene_type:complete
MRPSEILKKLNELRECYREQSFKFTNEQQAEYDRLKQLRRERVKYFRDNDLVAKGGVKSEVT